jgi:hypothetical protein
MMAAHEGEKLFGWFPGMLLTGRQRRIFGDRVALEHLL